MIVAAERTPDGQLGTQPSTLAAGPFRLVSLFDMLEFSAAAFLDLFTALTNLRQAMRFTGAMGVNMAKDIVDSDDEIGSLFKQIEVNCATLELPLALELKHRIVQEIDQYSGKEFADRIGQLQERVVDELKSKLCLFVPNGDADYYRKKLLFGADVDAKFLDTAKDIADAGRCFALDSTTATVFHLMRVLESGVKSFANKLGAGVGPHDAWGPMLTAINNAIQRLPQATQQDIEFRQDCQALSVGLNSIRAAWRNPTMHQIAAYYDKHEALDIWQLSRMFMRRLAKIV
jgi:hypothetical protein